MAPEFKPSSGIPFPQPTQQQNPQEEIEGRVSNSPNQQNPSEEQGVVYNMPQYDSSRYEQARSGWAAEGIVRDREEGRTVLDRDDTLDLRRGRIENQSVWQFQQNPQTSMRKEPGKEYREMEISGAREERTLPFERTEHRKTFKLVDSE